MKISHTDNAGSKLDHNTNRKGFQMSWKKSTSGKGLQMNWKNVSAFLLAGSTLVTAANVQAQSFSIDDNPFVSAGGFGLGAEDEWGFTGGPGLAPSPSLPFTIGGDGSMISPTIGGAEHIPGAKYLDAFSTNYASIPGSADDPYLKLSFSVDRLTSGAPGSASAAEFAVGQQPGDIYTSTAALIHPGFFAGVLGPGPFAGPLPSAGVGGTNVLSIDESAFGLTTAVGVVPPGVPAGPITPGSHDNVDAFDTRSVIPTPVGGVYGTGSYYAVAPDDAALSGGSAADLYFTPAGSPVGGILYAPAPTMGLDSFGHNRDSIDALIMFDGGDAEGFTLEPGTDYALFSLAPGSSSLAAFGLSPGDVFYTDFTGAFGVYAYDTDLGLLPDLSGGFPFQNRSNVDALTVIPEPGSFALIGLGLAVVASRRRRAA